MIGDDTAMPPRQEGNKVSIEIPPGRIPMQQNQWLTASFINKVHRTAVHDVVVGTKWEGSFKGLIFEREHYASPGLLRHGRDGKRHWRCSPRSACLSPAIPKRAYHRNRHARG